MKKYINRILTGLIVLSIIMGFCSTNSITYAGTNNFIINNEGILISYSGQGGDVVIPNGVTAIGPKAFAGCSDINTISMPNSIRYIDEGAFDSCSGLKSIHLSSNLVSIKASAFWGCSALKSIILPKSMKEIGFSAFANCESLAGIYIPAEVSSIGNYAFGFMYYGDYVPAIGFIIMGEKNSAAQEYADKYSVPFLTKDSLKTSISSVSKKSGNKLVVKWKKNTKVSGYEIQYSTSSKFASSKTKTIRVGKASATSKAISKIKEGTTYYVRIRGYRTISGKKYYSSWGKVLKK